MRTSPLEASLRSLVEDFVHDITELVRMAAFEALEEALGGTEPGALESVRSKATRLPVHELTPAPPKHRRVASVAPNGAFVNASELAESIVAQLLANPEMRAEELKRTLAAEPAAVKQALAALHAAGRIQASGRARGTRYSVAGERQLESQDEDPQVTELAPELVADTAS